MAQAWLQYIGKRIMIKHKSLKGMYANKKQIKKCGLETALQLEGMTLDGTHHRGIDDARNTAKIFIKYFGSWKF